MKESNRILIVDDEPVIREMFRKILSSGPVRMDLLSEGASLFNGGSPHRMTETEDRFDLTLVGRGEEGVKAVEEALEQDRPFAVAFIDMDMPGINGAETARRILGKDPRIKLVLVSGYSESVVSEVGGTGERHDIPFLGKPFGVEQVKDLAESLMHQWTLENKGSPMLGELGGCR